MFPLVVLSLLSNNGAPLIDLAVLVNRVVSLLLIVEVLDRFLFLLDRLLDAVSVKLERVNLQHLIVSNIKKTLTYVLAHFQIKIIKSICDLN